MAVALAMAIPMGTASAQDSHARRARVMAVIGEAPAVWLEDDRVWVPNLSIDAISVCAAGQCRPIIERNDCEVPDCPGPGIVLVAAQDLGSIDDFPDDLEDYNDELNAMRADSVLAQLAGSFAGHPDEYRDDDSGDGLGLSVSVGAVAMSYASEDWFWGGRASVGLLYKFDTDENYADSGDGSFFATMIGDRFGLEARARFLVDPAGQGAEQLAYSIGGALTLENRVGGSMFQVPSVLGAILPELGVFVRDGDPRFYGGFAFPVKMYATGAFAVEARASLLIVSSFQEDDSSQGILSLSFSGVLQ